jgi:hypothetical protein
MKCPHCLTDFNGNQSFWTVGLGVDGAGSWIATRRQCPTCDNFIFELVKGTSISGMPSGVTGVSLSIVDLRLMVWPKVVSRAPIPSEVPKDIASEYKEACLVLADSAKASAALSRRCLQNLLRQAVGVKPGDLYDEIQQVLDSNRLPSVIADGIDGVRVVGNFGAHPIKSKNTGEIVDVEPNEAEWNLDVLESLFDFYYVLPARAKAKKEALNKKLKDAGKPTLR